MGILDIIGEDLERLDEILNGSRGWFLQLGEDVTRVSFEFSFGEHYMVEYFPGLENPWAFYIDGIKILSGLGTNSDIKQKQVEALPLGESMKPETQCVVHEISGNDIVEKIKEIL